MNKEVLFNEEAALLMLKMRSPINREFNVLLSLHSDEAAEEFCRYGWRSQQPALHEMAGRLANLLGIPQIVVRPAATATRLEEPADKPTPQHRRRVYRGQVIED